jgi:hypothetical protein
MKPHPNHLAALSLLVLFVIACNNDKKTSTDTTETKKTDHTYIYDFEDASVPPAYHRSYTIKVTPAMAYLTINSYDNVLAKDSVSISPDSYKKFAADIKALNIQNTKDPNDDEGCTGGTTDNLELYSGSPEQVKGNIYHCGGKDYGDLSGDVTAATQVFRSMIPDINKKIDATRTGADD